MDSRIILDRPGAQQLVGRGDMLYLNGADPVRVQCAFVDTPEVENITKFIANQPGPVRPLEIPEPLSEDETGGGGSLDTHNLDPLFEEAARAIVVTQQGSTSMSASLVYRLQPCWSSDGPIGESGYRGCC